MRPAVAAVRRLSKRFGAVTALDDVDVEVREREVLGLIGENGSGKSTLLKILAGVEAPDSGEILLGARSVRLPSVAHANRHGIGMVFQEQSLIPGLSVAENIYLGKPTGANRGGLWRWRRLRADAQRQLDKVGSSISPAAPVERLSLGERQLVELAKVLALEEQTDEPLVVLLDEPTSTLNSEETARLFDQIRRLRERSAVIFVSHRLEEILQVSDRVYVLSDGRAVAERDAKSVDTDELYRLMVGEERARDYYLQQRRSDHEGHDVRLTVEGLSVRGGCQDVSLELRAGRVLGLAGVVGSGREALARAIFGAERATSGRIKLDGRAATYRSPAGAVAAGVGYVPAERKVEGMIAGRSVHDNVVVAGGGALGTGGLIDHRAERARVNELLADLRVKTPSADVRIDTLSGGNQQKIVLAKWLISDRLRLLILDHPTRGLDLRAKSDVYRLVRELTAAGVSVLLLSDTLEETIGLSDQIVVLRDGEVTGRFDDLRTAAPTQEALVRLMV